MTRIDAHIHAYTDQEPEGETSVYRVELHSDSNRFPSAATENSDYGPSFASQHKEGDLLTVQKVKTPENDTHVAVSWTVPSGYNLDLPDETVAESEAVDDESSPVAADGGYEAYLNQKNGVQQVVLETTEYDASLLDMYYRQTRQDLDNTDIDRVLSKADTVAGKHNWQ